MVAVSDSENSELILSWQQNNTMVLISLHMCEKRFLHGMAEFILCYLKSKS